MPTTRVCIQCGTEYGVEQRNCPTDGSPLRLRTTDDPLIGQVIAERYHILELLGAGGMGRVYVAEHVLLGRKSAVKVITPALATAADAITRFNREAANASRINHPNVAQIYDFGATPDGMLYLAMEFIEGDGLGAIIERLGPVTLARAGHIVRQVADALAAAHHLGIVHRDLKPENIMIGRQLDGGDWVKVVDFGIAKTMEREGSSQNVTTIGVSLGTPEYMSPEQFAGEQLDHRTDIYSLGLVCYNMLTGELPYPKVTSKETLVRRLTSRPRPLTEARADVDWPPGLQTALDRALAPDVGDRYNRVVDFGQDVMRAAERAAGLTAAPSVSGATTAIESVSRPNSSVRRPTTRPNTVPEPQKRRVWPLIAVALVGIAGVLAAMHPDRIASVVAAGRSTQTKTVKGDTAGRVASVPDTAAQSSPDLAVSLQGAGRTGTTTEPTTSQPTTTKPVDPPPTSPPAASPAPQTTTPPATSSANSQSNTSSSPPADQPVRHTAEEQPKRAPAPPPDDEPKLLRHPWLRVNGDSGEIRDPGMSIGPDDRRQALLDEVQGHLQRGHRFVARADVANARAQYRDAEEEARVVKLSFGAAGSSRVDFMMLTARREAFRICQTAQGDTLNPFARAMDCGALFSWQTSPGGGE